ncbi:MAG: superoxide dismutase family protein [Weeksellaceae bacterium]|nr:superoxide dismutase family protein [Weeksellaceae bacterium]
MRYLWILISGVVLFLSSCEDKDRLQREENMELVPTPLLKALEAKREMAIYFSSANQSNLSGIMNLKQEQDTLNVLIQLTGLEADHEYDLHLHQFANCNSTDLRSAGSYWTLDDLIPHDSVDLRTNISFLGTITTNPEGNGQMSLRTDHLCLDCNNKNKQILDKSVIVHDAHFEENDSLSYYYSRKGCAEIKRVE